MKNAAATTERAALTCRPSLPTFFDNLDSFAEAPEGVAKLRELMMHLALQGKLVSQDQTDEPVDVTIEQVAKQLKHDDSGTGKGRRETGRKASAAVRPGNSALSIGNPGTPCPPGWKWVALSEVATMATGHTPSRKHPKYWEEGDIDWVTASDANPADGGVIEKTKEKINQLGLDNSAAVLLPAGTVCLSRTGASIGYTIILGHDMATSQGFVNWICTDALNNWYLLHVLMAERRALFSFAEGSAHQTIYFPEAKAFHIALPPRQEQDRIVAKVNHLLDEFEELESARASRVRLRERASRSCLDRLVSSRSRRDLSSAWQRLSDHFEVLYDTPETLAHLRQSILQLAVQGKLVPQDPNDEPASELLETITAKRKRLLKEESIRKTKEPPPIDETDVEHSIPGSWSWARLADICELITDGTHYTPTYTDSGRMFLSAQNVKPFQFMPENHRFVSEDDFQGYIKNVKPEFEDVLLTRVGAGIGEAAVIDRRLDFAIYVSLGLIRPVKEFIYPRYIELWLNSPNGRQHSERNTYGKGVSQGNLNLGLIRSFAISVPPYVEQKRIVAKVDQLLSQCDELSARLRERQSATQQLLSAIIHQLLASSAV